MITERLQPLHPQLAAMFSQCYCSTFDTTTELLDDGTTFVFTGDIPAMWLRDSSAQARPYIQLAKQDEALQRLLNGLIQRQAQYILIDPYANAFNKTANGQGHTNDEVADQMIRRIVEVMYIEQEYERRSLYTFHRDDFIVPLDTLPFRG